MSDFSTGDAIRYSGTLGDFDGTVAAVKQFFDENGAQATLFDVSLPGVGLVRTSADSLSASNKPASPDITIPRSAYSDVNVPPAAPAGQSQQAEDLPFFDQAAPAAQPAAAPVNEITTQEG